MEDLKKGDRVRIEDNEIFSYMGFQVVTGIVSVVYPDGHGFGFKCDQTGCHETISFDDGNIEKL